MAATMRKKVSLIDPPELETLTGLTWRDGANPGERVAYCKTRELPRGFIRAAWRAGFAELADITDPKRREGAARVVLCKPVAH